MDFAGKRGIMSRGKSEPGSLQPLRLRSKTSDLVSGADIAEPARPGGFVWGDRRSPRLESPRYHSQNARGPTVRLGTIETQTSERRERNVAGAVPLSVYECFFDPRRRNGPRYGVESSVGGAPFSIAVSEFAFRLPIPLPPRPAAFGFLIPPLLLARWQGLPPRPSSVSCCTQMPVQVRSRCAPHRCDENVHWERRGKGGKDTPATYQAPAVPFWAHTSVHSSTQRGYKPRPPGSWPAGRPGGRDCGGPEAGGPLGIRRGALRFRACRCPRSSSSPRPRPSSRLISRTRSQRRHWRRRCPSRCRLRGRTPRRSFPASACGPGLFFPSTAPRR
ncbi:unnamed protein product [Prorocentrum cordatum]|uniref:Uncharacterized protein n=2 Tax=Prorocentrum cordatum TaxID=2364126 RepID=A0ABN9T8H2_9DINO|nr:unnamed protein product [Polarella glacialis]